MKTIPQLENIPLFNQLSSALKDILAQLNSTCHLTFQENRWLNEVANDFMMWEEENELIEIFQTSLFLKSKEKVFERINEKLNALKENPTEYKKTAKEGKEVLPQKKLGVREVESGPKIFGPCPVASEKTVCCNLKTIDAVQGCSFACNYCSIQTFYDKNYAQFEKNFVEKLNQIHLPSDRYHHLGTGQSSDSLVWGNAKGHLEALIQFAFKNPHILLELKTKSNNIYYLLKQDLPKL